MSLGNSFNLSNIRLGLGLGQVGFRLGWVWSDLPLGYVMQQFLMQQLHGLGVMTPTNGSFFVKIIQIFIENAKFETLGPYGLQ